MAASMAATAAECGLGRTGGLEPGYRQWFEGWGTSTPCLI